MRAAFSYYIHRPSTAAAVRLRQHFRLAASVSASLGWKEDPRPSNRSFFSPLFRAPLTFVQAHRGLCSSRSECSSMGGALPAMAETRRLRPQKPRRASLGLQVAAILSAMPRSPPPGDVLEGLAGASRWARPWRAGRRWSRGGRAQRPPLSRRIVGRARVAAKSPRGPAGGCREGSGS